MTSEDTHTQGQRGVKRLIAFIIVAVTAVVVSSFTAVGDLLNREAIGRIAADLGWAGPAALIGVGLVMPLLFLPRWPIAMAAGLVYGVVLGTIIANVASTLGAWLHFVLAQTLLAPTADRLRRKYELTRLAIPREKAFAVLFLLRAFPLSNFVATNLLAGALKIHLGTYMAATFLGMIPSTIMYAAWGKLLKKPTSEFYAVAAFTLLLLVGGTIIAQKKLYPWFKQLGTRGAEDRDPGQR